ncbi:MAG: sulfotransferase domain-containing protein [Bacteroidota bacterium]
MIKSVIRKTQKKFEKYATKENSLGQKAYVFLLSSLRPVFFNNEFLLMNGLKSNSKSTQKSVIFFTVHKCGSTFTKKTLLTLIGPENIIPIKLSAYLSPEKKEKYYNDPLFMRKVLKPRGFLFGAFKDMYPFANLEQYKVILVLRDPRDVVTSSYFSTLYNHPLTAEDMIKKRKKYADYSIDEYVLEIAPDIQRKYKAYCDDLLPDKNVLFLKYEEMVGDFSSWLTKIANYLELENPQKKIATLVEATKFKVKKEDKNSFVRNITPGDHSNKLQPETITKLNELFKNELRQLNYPI